MRAGNVTVAIPTYDRGPVLTDTVAALLRQTPAAGEIVVIDQTAEHEPAVARRLAGWEALGFIRWLRRERPSVPAAMNLALVAARCPVVLFLDDDIIPAPGLIAAHAACYADPKVWAVAGQVLQPGESPSPARPAPAREGIWKDLNFPFSGTEPCAVLNCMAGNLSVRRDRALQAGGLDENFVAVAYRFETEFCRRLAARGGKIWFAPEASIRHLRAPRGGTRAYGDHLRTGRPEHSVGEYYFALRHGLGLETLRFMAYRLYREVRTRHHLTHPWWIPIKLLAELRGLVWAVRLAYRGPRRLAHASREEVTV